MLGCQVVENDFTNRRLPEDIKEVNGVMKDPNNDKNYFIFYTMNDTCWKYDSQKQIFISLKSNINEQTTHRWMNDCAYFEIKNDNLYYQFALVNGGPHLKQHYSIYELQNQKWNLSLQKLIENETNIQCDFGVESSMITDIFNKNKIHIIGGTQSEQKYGCFKFNHDIFVNQNIGMLFFCFCRFVQFVLRNCANLKKHTHTQQT